METAMMDLPRGELRGALCEIRDREGVTFTDLAARTGVSRSAISQAANQGLQLKADHERRLWQEIQAIQEGRRAAEDSLETPVRAAAHKTQTELYETRAYREAMGWACSSVTGRSIRRSFRT